MNNPKINIIAGPMKSGKSLEMIARFGPYKYSKHDILLLNPFANSRESTLHTRAGGGIDLNSQTFSNINEVYELLNNSKTKYKAVGIEEFHMIPKKGFHEGLKKILRDFSDIPFTFSGLDKVYSGELSTIFCELLKFPIGDLTYKKSFCYECKQKLADYTLIKYKGTTVISGIPEVIVDDNLKDMTFEPYCFDHFYENISKGKDFKEIK